MKYRKTLKYKKFLKFQVACDHFLANYNHKFSISKFFLKEDQNKITLALCTRGRLFWTKPAKTKGRFFNINGLGVRGTLGMLTY